MKQTTNKILYRVNGRDFESPNGFSILEALLANNIPIPHLCYDPRLADPNRSCGLCIVKLEKENKIVRLCNVLLKDGMDITTNSAELDSFRKLRMEQLLADHNADCDPPCKMTCPAEIDIQGYLKQVAQGNFDAALRIIKEKNPFPMICGRVCPHPCENECRRSLTDEPVAINHVKRFVADMDAAGEAWLAEKRPDTGKKIAIVGAGPSGLSAAYYSAINGHRVTVFERQAKAGGMMRYGIPDYRLPQDVLDKEIAFVEKMGVTIKLGKSLGTNISLEGLQRDFDAVYMAVGSWQASSMRVEGEQLPGVYKGIEYLEQIAKGRKVDLGDKVIVVGGGNTAIDCARTALSTGSKHVSILYRRTREQMPAEDDEIKEAIHEGVEFIFLAAPVGFEPSECAVNCIRMALGEPDRSGRQRPVIVEGSEFTLEASAVIGAIGQKTNTSYLWNDLPIKLSKWGDIEIDGNTLETSAEKVFAGGDCVTGPATVVQAVAAGRKAAEAMDQYIKSGYVAGFRQDYSCSRGSFEDLPRHEYRNLPKLSRVKPLTIDAVRAVSSFNEVQQTITAEQAVYEAKRCLECGCCKRGSCHLRKEASDLGVTHLTELQWHRCYPMADDHPFIIRNTNKCISCGRCIAACDEIEGPGVLGFYMRQGKLCVGTKTGLPLSETDCVSCGQCVTSCPCGALDYRRESGKVFQALNDTAKTVIGFVAPAVRSLICDYYHLPYEQASPFIAGMLRVLGFDRSFDFSFAADMTVIEETTEFLSRLETNKLPLFTSCCPGWVSYGVRLPLEDTQKSPLCGGSLFS